MDILDGTQIMICKLCGTILDVVYDEDDSITDFSCAVCNKTWTVEQHEDEMSYTVQLLQDILARLERIETELGIK